jgi:hypothetical protein
MLDLRAKVEQIAQLSLFFSISFAKYILKKSIIISKKD